MRNKNGQGLEMNKLITIILIVIVVVVIIFGILYFNAPGVLKELFPDFTRTDANAGSNDNTVVGCDKEVATIAKYSNLAVHFPYSTSYEYIYLNGQRTNLYWKSGGTNPGKIVLSTGTFSSVDVAQVSSLNVIMINYDFLDENSNLYQTYKSMLPSINDLKILDKAVRINNKDKICKTNSQQEISKKESDCKATFAKFSYISNEKDLLENKGLLEDKDLKITRLTASYSTFNNKDVSTINSLDLDYGSAFILGYSLNQDACLFIRTNQGVALGGFSTMGDRSFNVPLNDPKINLIQLVARDPSDLTAIVSKTINLKFKFPAKYNGGEIIADNEFKQKVEVLDSTGKTFFITDITHTFPDDKYNAGALIRDYKIVKVDENNLEIYVSDNNGNVKIWHNLDCYDDSFIKLGFFNNKYLSIANINENSLSKNLNQCVWNSQ